VTGQPEREYHTHEELKRIREVSMTHFKFNHGLGDCANFAHALPLWLKRGHKVTVDCPEDKACLFQAAGCEVSPGASLSHGFWHPPEPGEPRMLDGWSGNKLAWNLAEPPLPKIGDYTELWDEVLPVTLNLDSYLTAEGRKAVDDFLAPLPGPIILLHTRGNTSTDHKNFPADLENAIYRELLKQTDVTIILLDWDNRVNRLASYRVRHLADDFRHLQLPELAYLMNRSALLIGVDSGPLHLARFTRVPALGLWFGHHPAHFALPRVNTTHIVDDRHGLWNSRRRHSLNLLDTPAITAEFVARQTARVLAGKVGRELVFENMLDRCRTWEEGCLWDRDETFRIVAGYLKSKQAPRMLETGCARVPNRDDWTAGFSTYVFGWLLDQLGGTLDSVDIDRDNVAVAREWAKPFGDTVRVHHANSLEWLKQATLQPFDAIYLDSADTGTPDFETINWEESVRALPHLKPDGLLLIDDTYYQAGRWHGKGAITVPKLLSIGWRIIYSGYQTLLRFQDRQAQLLTA